MRDERELYVISAGWRAIAKARRLAGEHEMWAEFEALQDALVELMTADRAAPRIAGALNLRCACGAYVPSRLNEWHNYEAAGEMFLEKCDACGQWWEVTINARKVKPDA